MVDALRAELEAHCDNATHRQSFDDQCRARAFPAQGVLAYQKQDGRKFLKGTRDTVDQSLVVFAALGWTDAAHRVDAILRSEAEEKVARAQAAEAGDTEIRALFVRKLSGRPQINVDEAVQVVTAAKFHTEASLADVIELGAWKDIPGMPFGIACALKVVFKNGSK